MNPPPQHTHKHKHTFIFWLLKLTWVSVSLLAVGIQPFLFLHIVELNNVLPLDPATATLDSPVWLQKLNQNYYLLVARIQPRCKRGFGSYRGIRPSATAWRYAKE